MGIPEFVPKPPDEKTRVYESPPWDPEGWKPERPGELAPHQAAGAGMGWQGPDQGYAWRLARQFEGKLRLQQGEHAEDAVAGCLAVATKRASLFGRAPVIHDLTIAFTVFGFLDDDPPADLLALRRTLFVEAASPHRYDRQRGLADLVPEEVLRRTPAAVADAYRTDWRGLVREGSWTG